MKAAGAAAVLGAALGYAGERAVMRREAAREDPAGSDDFTPLSDVSHHTLKTSDGGALHVVERGQGRPLVLLHGVTLSTITWHYQLLDLADRYRVLAVDHRGHGRSAGGSDGYTMERLGADLAEVLTQLDLTDALVMGHSMGGMATMRFAVDFPDVLAHRVTGLALMDTSARPAPAAKLAAAAGARTLPVWRRSLERTEQRGRSHMPSTDLSYLLTRVALGGHPSQTHVELTKMMTAALSPSVLADLMEAIYRFDVTNDLPGVTVPTEVIVGSRDNLTPPRHARLIASRLPHAELTVLPGCGHMAMLERRKDVSEIVDRLAARTARSTTA